MQETTITCRVVSDCDYLTVGETYQIVNPKSQRARASIKFWNERKQAGTYISAGMVLAYAKLGKLALNG